MTSPSFSLSLFVEHIPDIVADLENAGSSIQDFSSSSEILSDCVNSAITKANSMQEDEDVILLKRQLLKCKENFQKTQACSRAIMDEISKFLQCADMDETKKLQTTESVGKGDFEELGSYINTLKGHLDQCSKAHQDFLRACAHAEAHCHSAPIICETKKRGSTKSITDGVKKLKRRKLAYSSNIEQIILAGVTSTAGVFIFAKLLDFDTYTAMVLGITAAVIAISWVLSRKALARYGEGKDARIVFHRLQSTESSFSEISKGYNMLRNAASRVDSNVLEIHDTLTSLSVLTETDDHVQVQESFSPAFELMLKEVKKVRECVHVAN